MNEIRLSGIVGVDITSESVLEQLQGCVGDVIVNLNSLGGSFFEGFEIYNVLKQYSGHKTIKMGARVASAATVISSAADEIIAQDFTAYMVHEVSVYNVSGTAEELRTEALRIEKLNDLLAKRLADQTGKSESEIRQLMKAESWYYGSEIVDAGFADRLEASGKAADRSAAVAMAQTQFKEAAQALSAGESYHIYHIHAPAAAAETILPYQPKWQDPDAKDDDMVVAPDDMLVHHVEKQDPFDALEY
jgi:ATP-dependent Clp protease, protease subunit